MLSEASLFAGISEIGRCFVPLTLSKGPRMLHRCSPRSRHITPAASATPTPLALQIPQTLPLATALLGDTAAGDDPPPGAPLGKHHHVGCQARRAMRATICRNIGRVK